LNFQKKPPKVNFLTLSFPLMKNMKAQLLYMSSNMEGLKNSLDCNVVNIDFTEKFGRGSGISDSPLKYKMEVPLEKRLRTDFRGFTIGGSNLFHDWTFELVKANKPEVVLVIDAHEDFNSDGEDNEINYGNFNRFIRDEKLAREVIVYGTFAQKWTRKVEGYTSMNKGSFEQVLDMIDGKKVYISIDLDAVYGLHHDAPIFFGGVSDPRCSVSDIYDFERKINPAELMYNIIEVNKTARIIGGDVWGITNCCVKSDTGYLIENAENVCAELHKLFKGI